MKPKRKKLIITITALVLAAVIAGGTWFFTLGRKSEPVMVFPFQYLGMTEYWGDNQESYGPVTTDKIQTVFLSDTQQITEIFVQEGDTVKKGDVLMAFDTTLSDLELERKRLEVEKLRLQLEDAHEELRRIKGMRPMVIPVIPPSDPETDETLGPLLGSPYYEIYPAAPTERDGVLTYDGSSPDRALICWVGSSIPIGSNIMYAIASRAWEIQAHNTALLIPEPGIPEEGEGGDSGDSGTGGDSGDSGTTGDGSTDGGAGDPGTTPTAPSGGKVYVVIKVTQGNRPLASKTQWQGLAVNRLADGGFSFQFFTPSGVPDYSMELYDSGADTQGPTVDYGSGYTSAQLAQMRADQEKKIRELELSVRMAETDYRLMELEMSDGKVYAQIDGTIISLLPEDEARQTQQPILKLSGGGGFYVEGFVSELEKDNLIIGQEVTVNDWNTGMAYPGTIHSIGDFPSSEGYFNGMGNPNTTYYPFLVFVDGSADLQEGRYVSVQYSSASAQSGIYLENPFLRTEQGKTYVYVRGEDGKLEKRYVTTGKSLWGSYTEVISGLTEEDYIAFPYGKHVKPGAPTREGDLNELYS